MSSNSTNNNAILGASGSLPSTASWSLSPTPIIHTAGGALTPVGDAGLRNLVIASVVQEGYFIRPTGSRVTKSGWTDSSGWDYVVLDPEGNLINKLSKRIGDQAFINDGSGNPSSVFDSWKVGNTNLILVKDKPTFEKYMVATELIKTMDCKTKQERVAMFDLIFKKSQDLGVPF